MNRPTQSIYLFLDTETTGLDYRVHYPWEVAAEISVVNWARSDVQPWEPPTIKHVANFSRFVTTPYMAGPPNDVALDIGRYEERFNAQFAGKMLDVIFHIEDLVTEARAVAESPVVTLVGACPWFDDLMLRRWAYEAWTRTVPWHYHFQDVEALGNGCLAAQGARPYNSSRDLSRVLLGDVLSDELAAVAHTAAGNVRWVREMFKHVHGLKEVSG